MIRTYSLTSTAKVLVSCSDKKLEEIKGTFEEPGGTLGNFEDI